ncbi:MAG TPA: hypothetical protein VH589_12005 [Trebonia sp.]
MTLAPFVRFSSAARHRSSPAARSAAEAVMNALFVPSHSTTSSTGSVRVKRNDAPSASRNPAPSGSVTECSRSSMART